MLLDFSRNRIEGTIPSALYSLTKLSFVDLSYNELVGSVDVAIGKLTNLGTFSIMSNDHHGPSTKENGHAHTEDSHGLLTNRGAQGSNQLFVRNVPR